MTSKDINDFLLTGDVTVGQAKEWIKVKDNDAKDQLIRLIHHRFYHRYVMHLNKLDSGFLKMAVSCLTIETLESFKQGFKDTKNIGRQMFADFFETEQQHFPKFKDIPNDDFYYSIRCGILHQAETTNAWRILRVGDLLDQKNKTINATKFVHSLEGALNNYIESLRTNDFTSRLWQNAISKIEDVCKNCVSTD